MPVMITDHDLLKKLKEGNEPAFRELYARFSRQVLAFAYHMTHSSIDAEDILQETFLRLWTGREQLPEVLHVGNYIFTIARNKTVDHLRKVSLQQRLLDQVWANISESSNELELQLEARESNTLIRQALAQLSPQQQTVFRLSRQQGLSHEEISRQLCLSKSRVKNLLVEILKYLRTYLSQHSLLLLILYLLAATMLR
ncbi:sigma-70 family RNA polymerase sigma factor [Chitinophaga agrisoli]|uniref:Sigma-70 family RNA polymerase sigma factor n=1 Tax=Chitinophaga agrisoli TaxID=2607653 RepID=A0A5B2VWY8_9BACT|nr:sigma-70 family RNA polymerase sigma factor [Chitinophaga agrisoli]KAA2243294.1 sigma-70 family RNA polymerase sigma factor [Chitinophaga agrisoli]